MNGDGNHSERQTNDENEKDKEIAELKTCLQTFENQPERVTIHHVNTSSKSEPMVQREMSQNGVEIEEMKTI